MICYDVKLRTLHHNITNVACRTVKLHFSELYIRHLSFSQSMIVIVVRFMKRFNHNIKIIKKSSFFLFTTCSYCKRYFEGEKKIILTVIQNNNNIIIKLISHEEKQRNYFS